jgi:16S rRNA processing protein RimM
MGAVPGSDQGEYLIVARVRRPHGIRGEVLVAVDTDRPGHVFRPGRILRLADSRGQPTGATVALQSARPTTGGAILRLAGIGDRNGADGLRGHTLLIAAQEAQRAGQDEVHYRDLIGLTAVAETGRIGTVRDILDLPTGEILVLQGEGGREILVPYVRDIVVGVDLEARELRLRVPEGLLDL